jgi:asparagine synthase (glutamine-hydrolysing)
VEWFVVLPDTEAMRGVVPDMSLRRRVEPGDPSLDLLALGRHRAELLALCEDSALARLGLVDAERLRLACPLMPESDPRWVALSRTFGCERWLRDLDGTSGV